MAGLRLILAWCDPRRRLIAALLIGWGLVVASGGGAAPDGQWLGIPRLDKPFAALAILYIAVVVVILIIAVAINVRRPPDRPDRRSEWRLLLLLSLLVLLSLFVPRPSSDDTVPVEPFVAVEAEPNAAVQGPLADRNELVALMAVLAAAIGVLVWTRLRTVHHQDDGALMTNAGLEPLIGRLVDGLELGPDPRSAVIRAYADLEEALADHGEARWVTDTPTEHLRRALAHLDIDTEPVLQLARLYEIARFSNHGVSVEDQRQAVAGLTRVRQDLVKVAGDLSVSTSTQAC